jgi:secondary thiamine-phosphate synthase enzyme
MLNKYKKNMKNKKIKINTDKLFVNITKEVREFCELHKKKSGFINIFSQHTTCCVKILEDEILHKTDVRFFLDKIAPKWKEPEGDHKNIKYLHDLISLREDCPKNEPINGHSHIRSLFFNSSETIPMINGRLSLGKWQSIFVVELDPNRDREIILTFLEG